jgi:type I restriction enzyme, S subunit
MSEWQRLRLGDLITIKHGYAFKGEFFTEQGAGPILLTPGNFLIGGGFKHSKPKHYIGPIPDEYRLRAGDLVITMTDLSKSGDTLGYPAIIPPAGEYLHNQRIGLITENAPSRIDKDFLYYSLCTNAYRRHVLGSATGSTVRHTSPSRISDYEFAAPALPDQESIAAMLRALEDKIEVNGYIVREADKLRALTLRRWERSCPDAVQSSPLSSFASFVNGRAFTKGATGTGRMVIRIAEINSGPGASTVYNDISVPDAHLARPGDILFAWSGSLAVARWYRPEAIVNQHIFKVIPHAGVPGWLMDELIRAKLSDFKSIAAGKATTMGHIQRHHLDEPVPAPKPEYIPFLDGELRPLWDRALAAEQESLTLAWLRDALLPGLMTGEVRVRGAEPIIEDAT